MIPIIRFLSIKVLHITRIYIIVDDPIAFIVVILKEEYAESDMGSNTLKCI